MADEVQKKRMSKGCLIALIVVGILLLLVVIAGIILTPTIMVGITGKRGGIKEQFLLTIN